MTFTPGMEIPEAVRQTAEKTIEQARAAYVQLIDAMKKSQDQISRSSDAMTDAGLDLQTRMLRFTEENLEAGFKLAADLARARDMKDYFEIQSRHAQRQMSVYALQAQELGQLMTSAAQKAQPRSK
jgi:phasin